MKYLFLIVAAALLCSCRSKNSRAGLALVPGYGVEGGLLIGAVQSADSDDLLVFTDGEGIVEYIYTDKHNYFLQLPDKVVRVGMEFKKIDQPDLIFDPDSSDKMSGKWYVSKRGFLVSVLEGEVSGIGVCKRQE